MFTQTFWVCLGCWSVCVCLYKARSALLPALDGRYDSANSSFIRRTLSFSGNDTGLDSKYESSVLLLALFQVSDEEVHGAQRSIEEMCDHSPHLHLRGYSTAPSRQREAVSKLQQLKSVQVLLTAGSPKQCPPSHVEHRVLHVALEPKLNTSSAAGPSPLLDKCTSRGSDISQSIQLAPDQEPHVGAFHLVQQPRKPSVIGRSQDSPRNVTLPHKPTYSLQGSNTTTLSLQSPPKSTTSVGHHSKLKFHTASFDSLCMARTIKNTSMFPLLHLE